jgi:uncharacterized DUF497 family protein
VRLRFEWDESKDLDNQHRRGISFEEAKAVFLDPFRKTTHDDRYDYSEERFQTIGMVEGRCMILFVAWTSREDGVETIRIISARRAKPHERRLYGNRKF